MGGMALGSALIARWSRRIKQLLMTYVNVEVLIGAMGLLFHSAFVGVSAYSLDSIAADAQ